MSELSSSGRGLNSKNTEIDGQTSGSEKDEEAKRLALAKEKIAKMQTLECGELNALTTGESERARRLTATRQIISGMNFTQLDQLAEELNFAYTYHSLVKKAITSILSLKRLPNDSKDDTVDLGTFHERSARLILYSPLYNEVGQQLLRKYGIEFSLDYGQINEEEKDELERAADDLIGVDRRYTFQWRGSNPYPPITDAKSEKGARFSMQRIGVEATFIGDTDLIGAFLLRWGPKTP